MASFIVTFTQIIALVRKELLALIKEPASRALLMMRLTRDAEQISGHFGLRYKSLGAERANVTSRYGVCYSDGSIRIRLRHAVTGRALKYSSLVDTLCHELAHLRHFNHGRRFQALYRQIGGLP